MGAQKVTLRDIAERAHVAISTVSMVLNNKALEGRVRISNQTIRKVRQIAREVGYLSARQTVVGLIMTWFREATEVPMTHSIIERLREGDNYHLAMGLTTKADPKAEFEELHIVDRKGFDGVIMEPSFALLNQLESEPGLFANWKNLVFLNRYPFGEIPCVTIDHKRCGYLATRHLLDGGHRRIAFMEGHYDAVPLSYRPFSEGRIVRDRFSGYCAAMAEAGEECFSVQGVKDFLAVREDVTGVYCAHTRGSTELLTECWQAGIQVPDDLSIVGQDDELAKEMARPPLTVVDVRAGEVGALAAQMVMDLLDGEAPESAVLDPRLVVRESVRSL